MRRVKRIHEAEYAPIADLKTYRALPTRSISYIDPFLFLNHHGPQVYKPDNSGLPFGPHPHRGMETVTFILEGDIMHKDSGGHESVITKGGIQWMTAGRGLIHAEVSSPDFMKNGGPLEILQLWINLPAEKKMTDPAYKGLQGNEIPEMELAGGKAKMKLISGEMKGTAGAFQNTPSEVFMSLITIESGTELELKAPAEHNVFFYVVKGELKVNGQESKAFHLVEFENDSEFIKFISSSDTVIIYGHAKPFNDPVVAHGPFVMNTEEQIHEAYEDYRAGKFGGWRG